MSNGFAEGAEPLASGVLQNEHELSEELRAAFASITDLPHGELSASNSYDLSDSGGCHEDNDTGMFRGSQLKSERFLENQGGFRDVLSCAASVDLKESGVTLRALQEDHGCLFSAAQKPASGIGGRYRHSDGLTGHEGV